jgi:hypothetical protein
VCVLSAFCDIFSWQDEVEKMGKEAEERRVELDNERRKVMTREEEHTKAMKEAVELREGLEAALRQAQVSGGFACYECVF